MDAVLEGTVSDETGATLAGATVTSTNASTGIARSAITDEHGYYMLRNLPAATYEVRAERIAFATKIRNQTLHVGTTVNIDFSLALAGVVESVTVRGALPAFETTKHTLARVVQTAEIDALPVVNRNFNDLATLAPGVTKPDASVGVAISGNQDFQNAYQIDGVSAERQHLGDQRMAYAQDWIQEFQVLTAVFNAEFGQSAGGVLNVITRSGGNQATGRAYGFFRDDGWDATPALVTRKPPLSEHRIGGTAGGPAVKNRLFYFGGIERFSNESSGVVASAFPSANGAFPSTETQTIFVAKVDAVTGRDHSVRVRYNGQRSRTTGSSIGGISTQEHGRFSDVRANDLVGNWSWIASPSTLSELRVAWSTSVPNGGCNFAAEHAQRAWFELSYPGAQFGCPVNFGTIAEDQLQLVHNLSWTHGRHDVKVGVQAQWTRSFGDFRNVRDGRYSFERDLPFSLNDPDSYPFSFVIIQGPTAWDVAGWSSGLFAQDSWTLAPDFTLNAGVRYDVDGSFTALNPLVRIDKGLHTVDADLNNVAPRAGFAWTPFPDDKRTVVRGGVGVYYDQNHNNVSTVVLLNNVLVDRIVTVNANSPLFNPFWPDTGAAKRLLAESLAQDRLPDLSGVPGLVGATNDIDRHLGIPATTQASGGLAHEFRRWLNASADVVYARGFDLYVIRNVNLDPISLKPVNPNYSSISSFGNGGWSRYKALQVQVNAVPNLHQLVKVAYTLATSRSNTNSTLSAGTATNPFDYSEDEGPANNDVRHTLAVNGSTTLPLGLQLSGILTCRSGLPYSATSNAPRPDGKPFSFRPEPRNARRGDGATSLDVRVAKNMKLGARHSATAFVEAFNLTNTLNYGNYIGTITSAVFGQPTTAGPMRRTQLGFRIDF